MATKAKGKKTQKTVIRAVPPAASPDTTNDGSAVEEPPTPRGDLEAGLKDLEQAYGRFQDAVTMIQSAHDQGFFKGLPQAEMIRKLRLIKDLVEKTDFALPTLRDEVKLSLAMAVEERAPLATNLAPQLPPVAGAVSADKQTLERHKGHLVTVLGMVGQAEVPVMHAKRAFEAAEFVKAMVDDLEVQIERIGVPGAA
jgi:hypothetical protein